MKKSINLAVLLILLIALSPNSVVATSAITYQGNGTATFRDGNKDGIMLVECEVFNLGGNGHSRRLESCLATIDDRYFTYNDHADLAGTTSRNGNIYNFSSALGWNNQETTIPGGGGAKSAWWMYMNDPTPFGNYVVMRFSLHRIIGDNYRSTFDGTVIFFEDDPTP